MLNVEGLGESGGISIEPSLGHTVNHPKRTQSLIKSVARTEQVLHALVLDSYSYFSLYSIRLFQEY
jgi:hypothetical protein